MPLPAEAKFTLDGKTTMIYRKNPAPTHNPVHGLSSLAGILTDIDTDRIEVSGLKGSVYGPPRWSQAKTCSLLDSVYRGYPAGSLLLWQPPRDYKEGLYHSHNNYVRRLLVVDGTYRLSTLYCFMHGGDKDDMISFRPTDEVFLPVSESIMEDPEYLRNARALWCHDSQVYDFIKEYSGSFEHSGKSPRMKNGTSPARSRVSTA